LDGLPETLDGTYARILEEIDKPKQKDVHLFFQCVAATSRPFRVDELAQFLAFDFEAESTPTFLADRLPENPVDTVLSMCSSLLAVVKPEGYDSPVLQFAHYSVKEYLTSTRLADATDTISRFHVPMTRAHTIIAQGCLGLLLHLDETVTKDSLKNFPLVEYAAENWVAHAQIEDVSLKVEDGMKRLFDPSKHHLSVWVWIYDPEDYQRRFHYERYKRARATPLHYATISGLHDVIKFLIIEHLQDVNTRDFDFRQTLLHVASRRRQADMVQLLLEHGADRNAQDDLNCTPLFLSSEDGHVEAVLIFLKQGADTETCDHQHQSPLSKASFAGHLEVCQVLLEHGADVKSKDVCNATPLHYARGEEVARLLLKYGADPNALAGGSAPLHTVLDLGRLGAARALLEYGVDANTRDVQNATPLHVVSDSSYIEHEEMTDVARLLLRYGSDIHARDDDGRTPFMRATEAGNDDMMRLLLEHGAEDHRKR
jgi:ankyrin repeat protein